MSHGRHNHRHHHEEEEQGAGAPPYYAPVAPGYGAPPAPYYSAPGPYAGEQAYAGGQYGAGNSQMMPVPAGLVGAQGNMYQDQQYRQLQAEEHRHKQNEHRAEMGALGAAVFAAYELHEEKVDPAHAQRHHLEAQAAEAATLGLGGYALYEHHEAHKMYKAEEKVDHQDHHHRHGRHHN